MILNYFDNSKYFNLFSLSMCIEFRQKSWESIGVSIGSEKRHYTHVPFLKILSLMLTESNSRNLLSEIIINNLETLLIKVHCVQWDFPLQILSYCLCILNQTLSYNFYVISQRVLLCYSICCVLVYIHIFMWKKIMRYEKSSVIVNLTC